MVGRMGGSVFSQEWGRCIKEDSGGDPYAEYLVDLVYHGFVLAHFIL